MKKKIKCPLCGADAPHKEENKVNLYICSECPFIAMEFYTTNDFKRLWSHYNEKELELLLK